MATNRTHADVAYPPGVAIHSLAVFRILFGLIMTVAMVRFLARGWVDELFLRPKFHFPYPGFEWIRPWPGGWMHFHAVAVAACALGVAVGFQYRVCAVLFFAGFTYLELIDQTTYLNHYYLVSLVAGLMMFMPAHRAWSIDAARKPSLRGEFVPAWTVRLLRFQFGVVYFFAGLAKLNADWLFEAQPLRIWLAACTDLPLLGPWLDRVWVAYAASWFAAAYDLSVPLLLLFSRTRPIAFAAVVLFHLLTWLLFPIGMFPWIMMAGALLFFPPNWPLELQRRLFSTTSSTPDAGVKPAGAALPMWSRILLGLYVIGQILLPVRAWWIDGTSAWSGDGFNWAWKVMIVEKRGYATFIARDPVSRKRWRIDTRDYITPRQSVMMAQCPHLIRALACHIADDLRKRGQPDIEIRADAFATLNGHPSQRLIDPAADLAGPLGPGWILPLQQESPRKGVSLP